MRALLGGGIETSQHMSGHLITQAVVVATDGTGFQALSCAHLSFAGPEQIIAVAFDTVVHTLTSLPMTQRRARPLSLQHAAE